MLRDCKLIALIRCRGNGCIGARIGRHRGALVLAEVVTADAEAAMVLACNTANSVALRREEIMDFNTVTR